MRKSKKKSHRQVKVPALVAQSKKTKIAHGFTNPAEWEKQIASFARGHQDRLAQDLLKAVPFWNWLEQQAEPNSDALAKWNSPLYRIVYGGFDPLSVSGSLAKGGRYNLGGAQSLSFEHLPGLSMQPALYAADSLECAKAEAGFPLGQAEIYELTCRTDLQLWNMEKVYSLYDWPNLKSLVEDEPFNKAWDLQKSPAISQLLATFLRRSGGDGIVSRSVKHPGGFVIAVFAKDDRHCQKVFFKSRL